MEILQLGPLRVRRVVKAGETTAESAERAPLTVVLMHGYGAPGDDLVPLGGVLEVPPRTTLLFPEAPSPLGEGAVFDVLGDARAWWPIDIGRFERALMRGTLDEVMEEVPPKMREATANVIAMLDALERETKTPGDRIVLGGFSQGSMLALDVALRSKRPLAGLALLSSTLLAKQEWLPLMPGLEGLRVFQSHGTEDPILPYPIAEGLHRCLVDAGLDVSFTSFEGGHGIPPKVMRGLGQWLRALA